MTFLVTTNGFVGSYLVNTLAKNGHTVTAVYSQEAPEIDPSVNASVTTIHADLAHHDLECDKADVIVHAAALEPERFVKQNVRDFLAANLTTTVNLAEFARRTRARVFVHLSDTAVYGKHPKEALTEESALNPENVYATSKLFAETALSYYAGCFVPLSVRVPVILGKGVYKNWLGDVLTQFKFSEEVFVYNAQALYNDVTDVYDVCRFVEHVAAMADIPGGVVNLAGDEPPKIEALLRHMSAQAGSISRLIKQDEKTDGKVMSLEKIKTVYGFKPRTVKEIVAQYFKDNM